MNYSFISLKSQAIHGIKNPLVEFIGNVRNSVNFKFSLLADGKEIALKSEQFSECGVFKICAPIDKSVKIIELYVITKDDKYLLSKMKNNICVRIINKIKGIFRKKNKNVQYDFIGLRWQVINGLKNPLLAISGTIIAKDYKFVIIGNNEEIEYDLKFPTNQRDFLIFAPLKRNIKLVEVYVDIGNERFFICKLKNSSFTRLKKKFKVIIRTVITLINVFIKLFNDELSFMWKKYHFKVPCKIIKERWNNLWEMLYYSVNKGYYEPFDIEEYNKWIEKVEKVCVYEKQDYEPLISICIPVYNVKKEYLTKCLDSILNQSYKNFEVCITDDNSSNKETKEVLESYRNKYDNIKVKFREENGNISKATNDCIEMAKGEFIGLMDNDDELSLDALSEVIKALNNNPKIDFIYSDEDKLNFIGKRCDPNFKPDFSPDYLLSCNYICHFTVIRRSLINEVGGFEVGLEGAQDYDLFLKCTEKTKQIYHIPKILYHWRMIRGSTSVSIDNKECAKERGRICIDNALKRRNIKGHAELVDNGIFYKVIYEYDSEPLVSIIIPTKDFADTLDVCLKSIYEKTNYKNYEIIVVNNKSVKDETYKLFENYKTKYNNFRVLDANYEFNYSKLNNDAVKVAKGEYICMLNNDTEVISKDWLSVMVGYAMQEHIGSVGPKLLYYDGSIQHIGVVLGLGGVASHILLGLFEDDDFVVGRLKVPYNYSAVTGACIVVSKNKYNEVNGLDENLKVAYNDVDFNIKLLKKGYYNVCTPQIKLYHYESKSRGQDNTKEKSERFKSEQKYMYDKWDSIIFNDPFYNGNYTLKYAYKLPNRRLLKSKRNIL